MASPKSISSALKGHAVELRKQKPDDKFQNSSLKTNGAETYGIEDNAAKDFIGVLDVYIHQARDIHNICIYHKQDVYAKLCLTSDTENAISTQIINGGGKNPVFNQNLRFNVQAVESSLKCEIWMLSRVRNYLEDQLLGFALVPISDVIIENGKLEKEFSLSSTDLFHSPAGFVLLSLSYAGSSPDVMAIPRLRTLLAAESPEKETEVMDSVPCELDKIEFPDPMMVNENEMMVSTYIELSQADLHAETPESVTSFSSDSQTHLGNGVEKLPSDSARPLRVQKEDSSPVSFSTDGSPTVSLVTSSQSSDTAPIIISANEELVSPMKEKKTDVGDGTEGDSAAEQKPGKSVFKPLVSVNVDMEAKVVQQDIMDLYMKSMQQFTESLAKMKLPMDLETESSNSPNSSSDQNLPSSRSPGSRVFYGSRAFF
ncbi:hypothetical protein Droror1_Dr00014712 [Drosera rotundifolia]